MLEVKHFHFDENTASGTIYGDYLLQDVFGDRETFDELSNSYNVANYISFDGKGIDLDNDNTVFIEKQMNPYTGFISADVSDENGYYESGRLHLEINTEIYPKGITFIFYGDCCRTIEVAYRNADTTANRIDEIEVEGASIYIPFAPEIAQSNVVQFDFLSSSYPYQLLKLQSIVSGEVNSYKKFKSQSLLEEIDILSADLPMNTFDCEVIADSEFEEDSPINVYSNNAFYGTFFVSESERIAKNIYSVKCYSPLYFYDKNEYRGGITPFSDFLSKKIYFDNKYNTSISLPDDFDPGLVELFGYLPIKSDRYALAAFAFATRFMVSTSRDSKVNLLHIPKTVTSVIKSNRIIGTATLKRSKTVTSAVWKYPLYYDVKDVTVEVKAPAGERTLITFNTPTHISYNDLENGNKVTEYFEYSSNFLDFIPAVDNVTLNGTEYEYKYTEVTVTNPKANERSKANSVQFKDFNILGKYVEDEYTDTEFKPFAKEKDIQKYISSKGTVNAKIILNGERVGDLIQIETELDGIVTGIITSMNIFFEYRDIAEIEVYEWSL